MKYFGQKPVLNLVIMELKAPVCLPLPMWEVFLANRGDRNVFGRLFWASLCPVWLSWQLLLDFWSTGLKAQSAGSCNDIHFSRC